MKWLIIFSLLVLFSLDAFSQAPSGIRYQAVIRGLEGTPLPDQSVNLRFTVQSGMGVPIYQESHSLSTSSQGLVHLNIGEGQPSLGDFMDIDWSSGAVSLLVELDPDGGTNYLINGLEMFQSVPYALYSSESAALSEDAIIDPGQIAGGNAAVGQVLKWNGTNWVPADDIGGGGGGDYIAGPGISIQGNVITNTGDLNPDDDVTITTQAGGDISGIFANLQINPGAVGSTEIAPGSIDNTHIAPGTIPTNLPPSGAASGDLSGNYPGPQVQGLRGTTVSPQTPSDGQVLKYNAATSSWAPGTDLVSSGGGAVNVAARLIGDGSPGAPLDLAAQGAQSGQVLKWNGNSWAPGMDETESGTPSGPAGGDLTGNYPNPTVGNNAITTAKLGNFSVTDEKIASSAVVTEKIANSAVTGAKIAQSDAINGQVLKWNGNTWAPGTDDTGSGVPSGPAGGDLTGNYPNPTVDNNAITTGKIANEAVTTAKLGNFSVTDGKIASSAVVTEKIANSAVTGAKIAQSGATNGQVLKWNGSTWAPGMDETGSGSPSGPAGGDLAGTYPNPTIGNNAVTTAKINNEAVTSEKLGTFSVTDAKIASSAVTTEKIAGGAVIGEKIAQAGATNGQVLKWTGSTWAPANDETGSGFTLPYTGSSSNAGSSFHVTNTGLSGAAIRGEGAQGSYALIGTFRDAAEFFGDVRVNDGFLRVSDVGNGGLVQIVSPSTGSRIALNNNSGLNWVIRNEGTNLQILADSEVLLQMRRATLVGVPVRNFLPGADNTTTLGNSTNRWSTVFAANGTINTSDARLKNNINVLPYGLSHIKQLNPVSYQWIDQPEYGTKLGFLAQEVEQVIPEVVHVGEEGRFGLNYAEMIPVLVKAIQELTQKVEFLENALYEVNLTKE